MRDGIDHRALAAELKALPRDAQRQLRRQVSEWARAAARSVGALSYVGLVFTLPALAVLIFGLTRHSPDRTLVFLPLVLLMIGTLLNLWSNRRARQWRRAHPFEEWLPSEERLG